MPILYGKETSKRPGESIEIPDDQLESALATGKFYTEEEWLAKQKPELQMATPTPESLPAPIPETKDTGFGSPEFLKSAALSTSETALPGAAAAIGGLGKSAMSAFQEEGFQPPSKTVPETQKQVVETIEASPEGKLAGQAAGTIAGGVGMMGATKGLSLGKAALADIGYQGTAGASKAITEGATPEEALMEGATSAGVSAAVPASLMGLSAAKNVAGRAIAKTGEIVAGVGVSPTRKEAIKFLTSPEGRAARDALYNKGLDVRFDEVAKDFKEAQAKGLVKNLDDYYTQVSQKVKQLGQNRDLLIQDTANVPTSRDSSLIENLDNLLAQKLPKETNTYDILVARNKLVNNLNSEQPTVGQQIAAAQRFKEDLDDIFPNLFVSTDKSQSQFVKALKNDVQNYIRDFQRQKLSEVDPLLAEQFDDLNAKFTANYRQKQILDKQARSAFKGLESKTQPSEKRLRTVIRTRENTPIESITADRFPEAMADYRAMNTISESELRRALAEGRIKSAPSDLVEAAKGLRAREQAMGTEPSFGQVARQMSPLESKMGRIGRASLTLGEAGARMADKSGPIEFMTKAPSGSLKERVMRTGAFSTSGGISQAFSDSEFRKEVPNQALRADIKLLDQPISKDGLTSLARKYNLPEDTMRALVLRYGPGVEEE